MERLGRNEINFSIKSRMMDMRKAVNHPYLIDYPVMEDGMYFRYNIQLPCCGSGSGRRYLFDPGSGMPGMGKIKSLETNSWMWIRIRVPSFGTFLTLDPGFKIQIRDKIPDPQHCTVGWGM
jgi:hypothetical protein